VDAVTTILALVISANGVYFLRNLFKGIQAWRRGTSEREKDILQYVVDQRDTAVAKLATAENERDRYRRMVARRDAALLRHDVPLPDDGFDSRQD